MKAGGRRPSDFIFFEYLETLMKPDASQSRLRNDEIEIFTNFSNVVGKFVVLIFKLRNEFTRV